MAPKAAASISYRCTAPTFATMEFAVDVPVRRRTWPCRHPIAHSNLAARVRAMQSSNSGRCAGLTAPCSHCLCLVFSLPFFAKAVPFLVVLQHVQVAVAAVFCGLDTAGSTRPVSTVDTAVSTVVGLLHDGLANLAVSPPGT